MCLSKFLIMFILSCCILVNTYASILSYLKYDRSVPHIVPGNIREVQPSDGVILKKGFLNLKNNRGKLRIHHYQPKKMSRTSKSAIIFIQGRNEHASMYLDFAKEAISLFNVPIYIYDVRGQGKSDGVRCHIDSYDDHVQDLYEVVEFVKGHGQFDTIHLTSHSTGGLISLLYLIKHGKRLGKEGTATLASPLLKIRGPFLWQWGVWGLTSVITYLDYFRLMRVRTPQKVTYNENGLTNDPHFWELWHENSFDEEFIQDKAGKCGPPTFGWLYETFKSIEEVKRNTFKIKTPLLFLVVEDDAVVDETEAINICNSHGHCSLTKYSNAQHILFHSNKKIREKVFNRIWSWRRSLLTI